MEPLRAERMDQEALGIRISELRIADLKSMKLRESLS